MPFESVHNWSGPVNLIATASEPTSTEMVIGSTILLAQRLKPVPSQRPVSGMAYGTASDFDYENSAAFD